MKQAFLIHALQCEACSVELDILHDVVAQSDQLIAKALMLSEIASIAKAEVRMRDFLTSKWRVRANQAASRAGAIVAGGGTLAAAYSVVDKIMNRWAEEVASRYGKDIEEIYFLARTAGHKKANGQTNTSLQYNVPNFTEAIEDGKEKVVKAKRKRRVAEVKPSFDLHDEAAVQALQDDQMLWIGRHYDANVRESVRSAVKPSVLEGVSGIEAGKRVAEKIGQQLRKVTVPGGFNGSDAKYFEGLAANTATNARVRGQVRSFVDIGVTRYEIVNPMDTRTSPICQFMNGRVFTIREGASQIESVAGATTPEQVKEGHPWISAKAAKSLGNERALARGGQALPPYHFRCRTTVDISTESISFSALTPAESRVKVPSRPEPTSRNTPKGRKPTVKPAKKTPAKRPATIPKESKTLKAA